ncbi:MAG: excinuclease ABC subunit UvrC [Desulfobacteraceae bacterium]|nr:excinuclease ABC subunit UvrC [Desulfobacteraceae bacterium]MBC2756506.1 excinuclease ABC subunit UvrC [Desulfobacteraceae bacterium]
MDKNLSDKLHSVSSGPGVYLMKDNNAKVIYVGKAANLKKRLASYFVRASHHDLKTGVLVKKISFLETIVTFSEKEALILESTLIKRYKPRYNVILKDDKRYPCLRIAVKSDYPCLQIVRKIKKDDAVYFGPYASAGAVRHTLKLINKTFKLRKCISKQVKPRSRPCLNYQMGLCLAPCCYDVNKQMYNKIVTEVRMFLNGQIHDLVKKLKDEMIAAARIEEFENAAKLRDKIFALEKTVEKQIAVTTDFVDRDVIGITGNDMYTVVVVLLIRKGFLQGVRHFTFKDSISSVHEIIDAFVKQYYWNSNFIPKEILLPVKLSDTAVYKEWLSSIKESKVNILVPKKGNKVRLIAMARDNAESQLNKMVDELSAQADLINRLQEKLRLRCLPHRIECFDNSGMMGKNLVAGMVVYVDGKPEKKYYRRYTIKSVDLQDDYACMKEVIERRFKKNNLNNDLPELLIVDGGKGQLNIAIDVLEKLNFKNAFDVIGIAKKDIQRKETQDKIYKPGRVNPVNFGKDVEILYFLQRIRDEAHRYAISFHRQKRSKTALRSSLDSIPGIGKKRKAALLKKFSSFKRLMQASVDEIADVPGMNQKVAQTVQTALSNSNKPSK